MLQVTTDVLFAKIGQQAVHLEALTARLGAVESVLTPEQREALGLPPLLPVESIEADPSTAAPAESRRPKGGTG